ncbi:MAG: DUF3727 domain-containing protein [Leptolyngbyaceae cyanobacterium RU_5_1]|nr:DUF3727 domain-containing protein [Leptolyngbyaceae cyanobacterium RU_5_1]
MDEEDIRINGEQIDGETVILTDEVGRTIACAVERFLEVEEQEYALLIPVDAPVEIFVWQGEDDEDEEAIPVEDEEEIGILFPIAKAVLEEQNLTLKRTAIVLTVEGDLPDLDEEDDFAEVSPNGEDDIEELQFLASFYHEEQEFAIYAPLDPFFILVRMDEANQPHLLSPEELKKLEPMLSMIEDQLLDDFED